MITIKAMADIIGGTGTHESKAEDILSYQRSQGVEFPGEDFTTCPKCGGRNVCLCKVIDELGKKIDVLKKKGV